uniref:Uncharacterized protein n=1 Tax=Anguilla anguilla TaxID=7936 RepID=A0A0E9UNS6_ANGAN
MIYCNMSFLSLVLLVPLYIFISQLNLHIKGKIM